MTDQDHLMTEVISLAKYISDRKNAGLVSEETMLQILYHQTARKAISMEQSWSTMRGDYKYVNDMLRKKLEVRV